MEGESAGEARCHAPGRARAASRGCGAPASACADTRRHTCNRYLLQESPYAGTLARANARARMTCSHTHACPTHARVPHVSLPTRLQSESLGGEGGGEGGGGREVVRERERGMEGWKDREEGERAPFRYVAARAQTQTNTATWKRPTTTYTVHVHA
eukprot:6179277-Pleurochrysis_carterae.AAC.2